MTFNTCFKCVLILVFFRSPKLVQSWNAVFLGERGFGVPTKFFCSSYIYGRCWLRIRMMPSWHPWGNWVICKLGRPLLKFHFWVITRLLYKIKERLWCLHLGFHGQWFWLDHCREDPEICICIIMQIRSAVTELASVWPKMTILVIITQNMIFPNRIRRQDCGWTAWSSRCF